MSPNHSAHTYFLLIIQKLPGELLRGQSHLALQGTDKGQKDKGSTKDYSGFQGLASCFTGYVGFQEENEAYSVTATFK